MIPSINLSAGEFFELIRPAVLLLSVVLSSWVLFSARKRFPLYQAAAWAIGTLVLPFVTLPLYLAVILIWRQDAPQQKRHLLSVVIYGTALLLLTALYLEWERRTPDVLLAQAMQAKVRGDTASAIKEYRRLLVIEDDPHTHKLLAIELAQSGQVVEAIQQFRLAERGGEPDDSIHFQLGGLLEQINQLGQARLEFQEFLLSETCLHEDSRCELARQKVEQKLP